MLSTVISNNIENITTTTLTTTIIIASTITTITIAAVIKNVLIVINYFYLISLEPLAITTFYGTNSLVVPAYNKTMCL